MLEFAIGSSFLSSQFCCLTFVSSTAVLWELQSQEPLLHLEWGLSCFGLVQCASFLQPRILTSWSKKPTKVAAQQLEIAWHFCKYLTSRLSLVSRF